jgi:epoxyqueuosine reductase
MVPPGAITVVVTQAATEAGFELVGISLVQDSPELEYFPRWIAAGHAGEMKYLQARDERGRLKRASLANAAPWARSVVVCAINYNSDQPYSTQAREEATKAKARGWISRYAWSRKDYHDAVLARLRKVEAALRKASGEEGLITRSYVDTGPIVERVVAKYAGIGWIGKNTCVLNQKLGSWLFLGVILTSLDLAREGRIRPLRHLHPLHRRLPDQRIPRTVSTGFEQVHFVSHHRKTGLDSRGNSLRHGAAGFWLRHLPGCLSVEPESAGDAG